MTLMEMMLEKPITEWTDRNLGKLVDFLEKAYSDPNKEIMQQEHVFLKEIVKRKQLEANHPEVQLLVKMLYEATKDSTTEYLEVTPRKFARITASYFVTGDAAKFQEITYGLGSGRFIADAIAVFGGYSNYEELESELF